MCKIAFILLFATVVVQGHIFGGTERWQQVGDSLGASLEELVDKAVADANASLGRTEGKATTIEESIVNPTLKALDGKVKIVLEKIKKEQARSVNLKKKSCGEGKEKLVDPLKNKFQYKIKNCSKGYEGKCKYRIKQARSNIEKNVKKVQLLNKQYEDCKQDQVCRKNKQKEIVQAKDKIPAEIKKSSDLAAFQIKDLLHSVELCASTAKVDFIGEGMKIKKDIEKCVNGN